MPLSYDAGRRGIMVQGYRPAEGEDMEVYWSDVSDGYFETLQIPLETGRTFTAADREGAAGVAIVNQSFVRRYWPGTTGLGQHLSINGPNGPFLEVVGVTRDGKYRSLGEDPTPFFYTPLAQRGAERFSVIVRTALDPAALLAPVRTAIQQLDPDLPLGRLGTLEDHVGLSLLPARLAVAILGLLGGLGLVLACLGIAGVVAFGVSQRVREIGVRIALGAEGRDVIRLMVRDALRLVGIGTLVGVVIALPLAMLARGFLYGLSPLDPLAVGGAVLLFGAVAIIASWVPARRAARVDPMVALRAE
jgi:predicted permease